MKNFKIRAKILFFLIKFSMDKRNIMNFDSFYFIGIGGVSMSALAQYMLFLGKKVGGSDIVESVYTTELETAGAEIITGETCFSVASFDVIIYTDAVKEDNAQLKEARSLNKIVFSRGEFLNLVSENFKNVIAIAGCHGKTTCTCMLAHIFLAANKNFSAHIGGRDKVLKNSYFGGAEWFITEACEYKKNFLKLKPDIAVVLNTGADHLECYGSIEALRAAYVSFIAGAEKCVTQQGNFSIGGITFGLDTSADYIAENLECNSGKYTFTVREKNEVLGKVKLDVYGEHNVKNALAAITVARMAGVEFSDISRGIFNFKGVERRFEKLGTYDGAICIADYAHHPDEIAATLKTAETFVKGKLYVIFQPHTYSRTKALFKEFLEVLNPIEELLIYKTFAAREYFDDDGSALTLYQNIKHARYGDNAGDICDFISRAGETDVILFLGAGDIYFIAEKIVK